MLFDGEKYRPGSRTRDSPSAVPKVESLVDIHIRIERWVIWWIGLGLAVGFIAVANMIGRNLSRSQEDVLWAVGALNWFLGGLVCWSLRAVQVQRVNESTPHLDPPNEKEWHSPSDFVIPGARHVLPAEWRRFRHLYRR
jgi:hypothetical protein